MGLPVLLALALWLLALPALAATVAESAPAPAPPRIGVLTMQPGQVFFERFGHDAIVVVDPDTGAAISYNFGYFDPTEADFLSRFVRGQMLYHLVALPAEQDLEQYRQAGRGVEVQWLDLEPDQARALAAALAERALPENSRYRYDYFTANCATQVRDALDDALGGALKSQLSGRSRGNTYRSEAVRLARPAPWMWLGFDLGLGPYADRALSRWEEAFVPMRLADGLREARNSAGRPLVLAEEQLLAHRIAAEPAEAARLGWPWALAGLVLAAAVLAAAAALSVLAAMLGYGLVYRHQQSLNAARDQIAEQGPKLVSDMLSYQVKSVDDDFAHAQSLVTDGYRPEFTAQQDAVKKNGLVDNDYWVSNSSVVSSTTDTATMLLLLQGQRGAPPKQRFVTASVLLVMFGVVDWNAPPREALGMVALQRGADGGNRNRRGVGAEDAVGADDGFKVGIQLLLGFEAFDNGFDDQGGIGQIGQLLDGNQAPAGRLGRLGADLAFFGQPGELGTDTVDRLGGGARMVVEQLDDMPGQGRHLGDTGAHGTGADDGDDRLLG